MDMETSLSAQVLEAIPPAGATWGDITREFPKLAPWTLDATIKGLVDSKLIRRTVIGDMGAFVRAEFVIEPLDGERDDMFEAREREMLRKARKKRSVAGKRRYGVHGRRAFEERYNAKGHRFCTRDGLFHPKSAFGKGKNPDGLHSWCRKCRGAAEKEAGR